MILSLKTPNPLPLLIFESDIVGNCEVLQQKPRAKIAAPPSAVKLPTQVAVVVVMLLTSPVVIVGITGIIGVARGVHECKNSNTNKEIIIFRIINLIY